MGKARFFKIVWSIILLSLVMFLAGCGGGGSGNSSVNPEEQTTINVTGKIVGSDNNPIAGATVTITSDPVVVTTNQWGEFSAKVAPGEHTITVTKGNETLYRTTFTAQEGSHVALGSITPNYPDGSGDTQVPTVPGSAAATAASSTQIDLSWNGSTDNVAVTAYRIYRNGTQLPNTVTGTTYSDTGLRASTQYCYTVSAGDTKENWSAQSAQSCATTLEAGSTGDTQAPTVPGIVTATAASSSQINLSWSTSTDNIGVTGYRLYRGGVFLKQVAGTSTTDTGLSANTPYCYTISAGDATGNWSAQSTQSCVTTQISTDTTPPTVISVSPLSNAVNVVTNASISATFSESVDPSTISGLSFAVTVGTTGILIPGNITSNGATVVFTPVPVLAYGISYRVTIRSGYSGIKDMAGNALSSTYSWSFTTVYNQIYDLFIQFIEQPTDANYTKLMNAVDALGTTQEAYLYKALGELMDIYRSPVAEQMMQDFGITVGLDTNLEQLSTQYTPEQLKTMVYNYLKMTLQNGKHRYLINYNNLLAEMEQRLTRVDNLLALAEGINLPVNLGQGESVIFDTIDIKVMRAMTNLLKANFIYLQSIDLEIKNYDVTYNGSLIDIRDLMNEPVYDDTQSEAIMRELCTKADNVNLFTYSDRSKLAAFRNTLANAFGYYRDAVNAIQGLNAEEKEARFLNAFSLDSPYSLELAKTIRDYTMPSILNCIDNNDPLIEFISPRSEQTGQEYVDGGDGFYYLQKYYDIYLDHFCFDTTNTLYAYTINAYNLLSVNGSKTLRDMAVETDNFVRNTPHGTNYLPYRLYNTVIYLTGLVEKLWDDFFEIP